MSAANQRVRATHPASSRVESSQDSSGIVLSRSLVEMPALGRTLFASWEEFHVYVATYSEQTMQVCQRFVNVGLADTLRGRCSHTFCVSRSTQSRHQLQKPHRTKRSRKNPSKSISPLHSPPKPRGWHALTLETTKSVIWRTASTASEKDWLPCAGKCRWLFCRAGRCLTDA